MDSFFISIITMTLSGWWENIDWWKTYWLVLGLILLWAFLRWMYYEIKYPAEIKKLVNEKIQREKEEKKRNKKPMNTIQKICILLCIVFFFATAGFGDTQTEIAAITTGLMIASFIGYFLFKDK